MYQTGLQCWIYVICAKRWFYNKKNVTLHEIINFKILHNVLQTLIISGLVRNRNYICYITTLSYIE